MVLKDIFLFSKYSPRVFSYQNESRSREGVFQETNRWHRYNQQANQNASYIAYIAYIVYGATMSTIKMQDDFLKIRSILSENTADLSQTETNTILKNITNKLKLEESR